MTYRSVLDSVVIDITILTTHTNPIRPLLKRIRPTGSDIIMLNGDVEAREGTLGDMQAGPTPGVERMDILDQLARISSAHLNVSATIGRTCSKPSTVYLSNAIGCKKTRQAKGKGMISEDR